MLVATAQPNVLVVHPSLPAKSVKELVALAKRNPGQLNFGSSGSGAATHLAGELFGSMAGAKIVHIPYKGAPQALTDVVSGQVQMMFATVTSAKPFMDSGRLRALAVTDSKRVQTLPQLPTIAEAGLPGYEARVWHGLVAPAGTPAAAAEGLGGVDGEAKRRALIRSPRTRRPSRER